MSNCKSPVSVPCTMSGVGYVAFTVSRGDTTIKLHPGHGENFPPLAAGEYFYVDVIGCTGCCNSIKVIQRSGDTLRIEPLNCSCVPSNAKLQVNNSSPQALAETVMAQITFGEGISYDCSSKTLKASCSDTPCGCVGCGCSDSGGGESGVLVVQGPMGLQGPKGDTGATGPKGDAGVQGPKGDTGATGPKGDTGEKGAVGNTGPQGIQGNKGDQGVQGIQGIQGERGADGKSYIGYSVIATKTNGTFIIGTPGVSVSLEDEYGTDKGTFTIGADGRVKASTGILDHVFIKVSGMYVGGGN